LAGAPLHIPLGERSSRPQLDLKGPTSKMRGGEERGRDGMRTEGRAGERPPPCVGMGPPNG